MSTIHRAKTALAACMMGLGLASATSALAAEGGHPVIDRQKWSFGGFLGKYDDNQLQRGFRVYQEVCSRCHGLSRVYFRNLAESGGPGFPEAAVKSLAATFQYNDLPNDQGKVLKRPGRLTDPLPSPYANPEEARAAQNGALPPDLSLIVKARAAEADTPFYRVPDKMLKDIATGYQEGGADYLFAFLSGYADPPAGVKVGDFMNYNKAFPGHQTAMPNPFLGGPGLVKYDDGTPETIENYQRDVTAFLAWASDPRLEERKRMGMLVMFYLLITAILFGLAKRRIWAKAH